MSTDIVFCHTVQPGLEQSVFSVISSPRPVLWQPYVNNFLKSKYLWFTFLLLFEIRNHIVPMGSTPKGGPTEITLYHPGHSSPPGLVSVSVPSPPVLMSRMHPASGPYPPLSSCPIHIPYRVSGLFLPCFSVLQIYSNPTDKNPSTNIKPHIQTVLIHYFNKQTIKRAVYHYLVSPPVSSVPTCSSAPHLHQ